MGDQTLTSKATLISLLVIEVVIIILFGIFVRYNDVVEVRGGRHNGYTYHERDDDYRRPSYNEQEEEGMERKEKVVEVMFEIADRVKTSEGDYLKSQNVQVMVFIGFAFLMTYLKKYARSTLGFSFLLACIVIQWYILLDGFIYLLLGRRKKFMINLDSFIQGDLAAATFLISLGAVLGQFTPLQLIFMALIEPILYLINKFIFEEVCKVVDVGGSMFIHEFGAYFGVFAVLILGMKNGVEEKGDLETSSYLSDTTSMMGTLFLWLFWPSFNVASSDSYKDIVYMNTFLALLASIVVGIAVSIALSKTWKFNMLIIQNASLAGGVGIGSSCSLAIDPVAALCIGALSGTISAVCYRYLNDFFNKKLRIHDTLGVQFLHGIPGIFGGLVGVILAIIPFRILYGVDFEGSIHYPNLGFGTGQQGVQAAFQAAALIGSFVSAAIGGVMTGALATFALPNLTPGEKYTDDVWWEDENGNTPPA